MVVIKTDTEIIRFTEHDVSSPPSQKDANGNQCMCAISIHLTNSQPNFSKLVVKITLPSIPGYLKRIKPVRFINQLLSLISRTVSTYFAPHIVLIWSAKQFGEYHALSSLLPNTISPLFLHVFPGKSFWNAVNYAISPINTDQLTHPRK
jgi:hypothetical protein